MDDSSHRRATAYHEAGHAVVALSLGRSIQRVSIVANEHRLGHCEFKKGAAKKTDDLIEAEILILLGGLAAEARETGEYGWLEAGQDLRDVRVLTHRRAGAAAKAERLERRLLDKVEHLLSQPGRWDAVERIAGELLKHEAISGRAARHLFDEACSAAED